MAQVRLLISLLVSLRFVNISNRWDVRKLCGQGRFTWNGQAVVRAWYVYSLDQLCSYSRLPHQDMLTPVSEPLDKLTDLQPDEMYVLTLFRCPLPKTNAIWLFSDNMKGFQDLST